jgi:protein-disulfide isomerase
MSTQLRIPVSAQDHVLGDDDAPVTLVEYGDYQCPYCGAARKVVRELLAREHGDVRLVFRHFPLTQVHPMAEMAAEAAEFFGERGQFWPAHEAMYANQERLGPDLLAAVCETVGLDAQELREALEAGTYAQKVQADFMGGVRSGVNGTPTFFINGVRHDGGWSLADLQQSVDEAKAAVGGRAPATPRGGEHPRGPAR